MTLYSRFPICPSRDRNYDAEPNRHALTKISQHTTVSLYIIYIAKHASCDQEERKRHSDISQADPTPPPSASAGRPASSPRIPSHPLSALHTLRYDVSIHQIISHRLRCSSHAPRTSPEPHPCPFPIIDALPHPPPPNPRASRFSFETRRRLLVKRGVSTHKQDGSSSESRARPAFPYCTSKQTMSKQIPSLTQRPARTPLRTTKRALPTKEPDASFTPNQRANKPSNRTPQNTRPQARREEHS